MSTNLSFWKRYGRNLTIGGATLFTLGTAYYALYNPIQRGIKDILQADKKQTEIVYGKRIEQLDSLNSEKAREDSTRLALRANSALTKAREDSLSAASSKKEAEEAKKRESAAVAQAQKIARDAQQREREYIQGVISQYASTYPGFNLMIDYVVEGQRNFHSQPLPWKASLDNSGFTAYMTSPTKNIEDFLKIKELGEKGFVPEKSVDSFLNGQFDTYVGDVSGEEVRVNYHVNASDGKIYGVKLQNDKIIGLDELARQDVKYTVLSREEIKKKMPKINIPSGWRKMQSYQNQKK